MNRHSLVQKALGAAALIASAALPGAPPAAAPAKIGFVYVGPVGNAGWTFQHDVARRQMEKEMGGKVTTTFVENVPEGADSERVIREMARSGCKVVFCTSFGYMNPTLAVAKAYPNTVFMHATGYKTAPNVGVYNARFYEARYLCGVMAGRLTRSHVAGIVAAFPIPEVVMGINAFTRGMRSVDPKARVKVIWTNSWFDPGKEREAALTLITQGADMMTHDTDSTAVIQAAEEKGVGVFGYNSDEAKFGPRATLTSLVHLWGNYYTRTVKAALAGTWKPENVWGGFNQGMIALAPFGPKVPKELGASILKLRDQISAGKFHPFAGPVVDQAGTVRVPAGKTISDADLDKMNYYVEGVDGVMPKA
ncbi:BMP family ABC transporter substrate-binding protein [Mesoterricola silvestris]|uniref:BMP family ABC transporter substrate-binding protein n=1 Tax=Mesoterricola silvestris TaxID=2927979 RepID=A0AA48GEW2_9BACT|nr:BMP family ABC transporter substrate-binding protein [Mesoterricola silvestris]BDU71276.1 BMP family ABC transporter substrate-binding protein [Mesoterricola silvestris]